MLHERVSAGHLAAVRIGIFGMWLAIIASQPLAQLAELPPEFLHRIGVMRLFPPSFLARVLDGEILRAAQLGLIGLLVLLIVGVGPYRSLAVTAACVLTVHQGVIRGFTGLTHRELALLYCTYTLALGPLGRAVFRSRSQPSEDQAAAVTLRWSALVVLLTYAAVGAHRLAAASPEIFLGDEMLYFVADNVFRPVTYPLQIGPRLLLDPAGLPLLNAGFALTTLLEVLAPLCVLHRGLRHVWLVVMLGFHFTVFVLMSIAFWQNALLLVLLLIDARDIDAIRSDRGGGG